VSVLVDQAQFAAISQAFSESLSLASPLAGLDQSAAIEIAKSLSSSLAPLVRNQTVLDEITKSVKAAGFTFPNPAFEIAACLAPMTLVPGLKELEGLVSALDLGTFQRYWSENAPDNWAELEDAWLDIFDVIAGTGLCVVWAPDDEIVREMIAATSAEACLVQNRDRVLDALESVLERARGVPITGHGDACEFAEEAIASARRGSALAAQAVAACGFATVLNISHGINFGTARTRFVTELGDTTVGTMRASAIRFCSHQALAQYTPGGPPPNAYARHATHHGARANFSEANALSALLLLVAWLRELKWIEENDPISLADFTPA
jgi:hypothetical protein